MLKTALFTAAALGLLCAAPAMAKSYPNGGVTGDEIAADLISMGQKATVGKDSGGDPMINASFALSGTDINYKIFFYGCKEGRCSSIQYHVAFDGDADKAAKWNKENRFARLYATDKTVHVEYDVDVEVGSNTEAIKNTAERFKALMVAAVKYAG